MPKTFSQPRPELSRPLGIDKIPLGGIEEHIVARPEEREGLAKRFSLISLGKLEAMLNVDRVRGGRLFSVTGNLKADVVQECVVTLEPVPDHVEAQIDVLFAPPEFLDKGEGSGAQLEYSEEEAPEAIENGKIELGEVVSQHLALALNPYPRLPDAVLPQTAQTEVETKEPSPFAVLKEVFDKKK